MNATIIGLALAVGAPCPLAGQPAAAGAVPTVFYVRDAHGNLHKVVRMAAARAEDKPKDIVDTAVGAGSFTTLVAAVKAAGLVDVLKGEGPFTVFAPTDEAFKKLPAGTVESLLKPENKDKLIAVLKYHVVAGKVTAADVVKLKEAKTVQGGSVKVEVKGDAVMIDGAKVVKTDIITSNGVIHVIDSVLLPK